MKTSRKKSEPRMKDRTAFGILAETLTRLRTERNIDFDTRRELRARTKRTNNSNSNFTRAGLGPDPATRADDELHWFQERGDHQRRKVQAGPRSHQHTMGRLPIAKDEIRRRKKKTLSSDQKSARASTKSARSCPPGAQRFPGIEIISERRLLATCLAALAGKSESVIQAGSWLHGWLTAAPLLLEGFHDLELVSDPPLGQGPRSLALWA